MTDKYYPRGEIKKLEIELWNLKVKGTDVASYTLHFQELALMCGRMFHKELEEVEKYVGTDNAKILRKRSKPDKHGHGNGIKCAKAGRMLSKDNKSQPLVNQSQHTK
ncbi:hypothetical protein Tco_1083874 [Tanacetum coccineum]